MRLRRSLVLAVGLVLATSGVVLAAFIPTLQASGTAERSEIYDFVKDMKEMRQLDTTQLRIIEVTVDAGGTGWHTHPGTPSLVIVESGQIDYLVPDGSGACSTARLDPGDMIYHPSSVHDLRAVSGSAVFTVIYFSVPGVALTHGSSAPC